jgi:hypothetical protein
MSKVDWSTAPEGAEFYAGSRYRRNLNKGENPYFWSEGNQKWSEGSAIEVLLDCSDFQWLIPAPAPQWPDESRIDIVATNGNTGEHYEATELTTAADFLSAGLEILSQRGGEYGNDGRECSFPQAAEAFNALTGHNLKGSDICLIIALVKQVRQYAQPSRFHEDSAVDSVNYLALQSELLKKERT